MKKKNLLISTGGSGGHVIPASIFYDHLEKNFNVFLTTDKRGYKFLNKEKYKSEIIDTPNLSKNIFMFPFNLFLIFSLVIKSIFILRKNKIDILLTTGGYMSLPLCLAGILLKIKLYLFEPNMVIGRANKVFLRFSKKIICYSHSIKQFPKNHLNKIIQIKPLVRKEFFLQNITNKKSLKESLNLLIIGGSQGAAIFDSILKKTVIGLSKKYNLKVYHQISMMNFIELRNFYSENRIHNHLFSYDDNFLSIISKSNLCITRAGASTLSELVFLNIPFITIPLKNSKDNHQYENALFYKNLGCCWVINQEEVEDHEITKKLISIIENDEDYLMKQKCMKEFSYQNSWNDINLKIIKILNEN